MDEKLLREVALDVVSETINVDVLPEDNVALVDRILDMVDVVTVRAVDEVVEIVVLVAVMVGEV